MTRKVWVASMLVLVLMVVLGGSVLATKEPITIIIRDPDIQTRIWAYNFHAPTRLFSCQTLEWSTDTVRTVTAKKARLNEVLGKDHCGNFDSLQLFFRVWYAKTGDYVDYDAWQVEVPWGATWTFQGGQWHCDIC